VSQTSVRRMLAAMKYSLQSNRKTREGNRHPDWDGQFRHISDRVRARRRRGEPALSVDTKKKEVLGNLKNPGRTYGLQGDPIPVKTHDFPDPALGKAVPYGVYDFQSDEAGVSVGISHDTAEFAVAAIRWWWEKLGRARYGPGQTGAGHGGQRRQQRFAMPAVEGRVAEVGGRDGADGRAIAHFHDDLVNLAALRLWALPGIPSTVS